MDIRKNLLTVRMIKLGLLQAVHSFQIGTVHIWGSIYKFWLIYQIAGVTTIINLAHFILFLNMALVKESLPRYNLLSKS